MTAELEPTTTTESDAQFPALTLAGLRCFPFTVLRIDGPAEVFDAKHALRPLDVVMQAERRGFPTRRTCSLATSNFLRHKDLQCDLDHTFPA